MLLIAILIVAFLLLLIGALVPLATLFGFILVGLLVIMLLAWVMTGKGEMADGLRFLAAGVFLYCFMLWWFHGGSVDKLNSNSSEALKVIDRADARTLKLLAPMYGKLDRPLQEAFDARLNTLKQGSGKGTVGIGADTSNEMSRPQASSQSGR